MKAKKAGVTLVEVMIGVFLSSLVLGSVYSLWGSARRDVSTASVRQVLSDDVKLAVSYLAKDFQAIKQGSLEVKGSTDGNSAVIKLQRYSLKDKEEGASSASYDYTEEIEYTYQKPFLKRRVIGKSPKTLASHLTAFELTRGGDKTNHTTKDFASTMTDQERALNARIDISMTGTLKVNVTGKIQTYTERTSVFMREEFQNSVSEKRYLSMLKLFKKDKLVDEEKMLDTYLNDGTQLFTDEQLMAMNVEQLGELSLQEQAGYEKAFAELSQIDKEINNADTKLDRWWIFDKSTEVTDIQKNLKKIDASEKDSAETLKSKSEKVEVEKEKLSKIINEYEVVNMEKAFGSEYGDLSGLKTSSPAQYKELKEVYDMMIRDRTMKEIHDQAQKDSGSPTEYVGFLDRNNPETMVQGLTYDALGNPINVTESASDFAARKEAATKQYRIATKMDMEWINTQEGEDSVKMYTSAKNLYDLADTKKASIETLYRHKSNMEKIDGILAKK
jgi:type II secretory pathway component PulJ